MRRIALFILATVAIAGAASAQIAPPSPADGKQNANPCRDEVAAALQKLRKSSWFRMETDMLTENGPIAMKVDYVLPDRMHQTVTSKLTNQTTEIILVGDNAWAKQEGGWRPVPQKIAAQLREQMDDMVVKQQTDVGNYSCKGRAQVNGRDVLSYKLETEAEKGSAPQNQAFRMFYVDATTGLPSSNALLAPGHEDKPVFKTTYSYPLDLKIDPPKDPLPDTSPDAATSPAPAGK
jgi:hypothetical protein